GATYIVLACGSSVDDTGTAAGRMPCASTRAIRTSMPRRGAWHAPVPRAGGGVPEGRRTPHVAKRKGEHDMAQPDGSTSLPRCLKEQGVGFMFGSVGFPVAAIAGAAQREGIRFIGMRNEQAASYAARAAGYLTGRPQACLTVTGPGVIHALAGLADARQNCWPMILIGGASPTFQDEMGSFQEEKQVEAVRPFSQYAV